MSAYYNEHDPKAAAWLRELIKAGHIAPGEVDERSICDVRAADLVGFGQCHFFAGIGGWSLALRLAGAPDDAHLWTGSCPCQPFSLAGKGLGTADERHLWPAFFDLIRKCQPELVFGEQVASAIGKGWLDGVSADLEGEGYACGASVLGAHSVGAPHIRQRLYWLAYAGGQRCEREYSLLWEEARGRIAGNLSEIAGGGELGVGPVANTKLTRLEGLAGNGDDRHEPRRLDRGAAGPTAEGGTTGDCGLGDTASRGCGEQRDAALAGRGGHAERPSRAGLIVGRMGNAGRERNELGRGAGDMGCATSEEQGEAREWKRSGNADRDSGANGPWSRFDILPCRDGKSRRVESCTFPLAHGVPGRVGLLRGYGNAIVPQVAAAFVQASLEAISLT